MGWAGVLASLWIVIKVIESTASEGASRLEPGMTQKEVTFNLDELGEPMRTSLPGPVMVQKDVSHDKLWEPIELPDTDLDVTQREVTFELLKIINKGSSLSGPEFTQRKVTFGPRPPKFSPRFFGAPSVPSVPFPPARPSSDNLAALCRHGGSRPRYPPGSLPHTGFSHLRRYGDAINRMESWYSMCCQSNEREDQALTLCCVQQAWEQSLSDFCATEFTIKTSHYHCCKKLGDARLLCFEQEAPNPSYMPTTHGSETADSPLEPGFTWNRSKCQSRSFSQAMMTPRSSRRDVMKVNQVSDISFPPGRPTPSNIESVCVLQNLRPQYSTKCLPRTGYGWLARQSKAINRLERALNKCCKQPTDVLKCADEQWQKVIDQYCMEEQSAKTDQFPCCQANEGEERYTCFSNRAPHPHYSREIEPRPILPIESDLVQVCEIDKLLIKMDSIQLPIPSIVSQCCLLPRSQGSVCVLTKLNEFRENMCVTEEPSMSALFPNCCLRPFYTFNNCLSEMVGKAIENAVRSPHFRRRKCPLS